MRFSSMAKPHLGEESPVDSPAWLVLIIATDRTSVCIGTVDVSNAF
jgi:hypothetical protein